MHSNVLIIGAGSVGGVVAHKCAQQPNVFSKICLASRNEERCRVIASHIPSHIHTAQVDANNPQAVVDLIQKFGPNVIINAALPLQNLPIMEACVQEGVHYIDTSDPEADPSKFELLGSYKWQWNFHDAFRKKNSTAILSCGFDPGVVNAYCAYAQQKCLDEIHEVDIVDYNAGDHGLPFATNFNPVVNIQEVTSPGIYYENGKWKETKPLSIARTFSLPELGKREMRLMYHPELESLVKHFKRIRRIQFWMGFSKQYLIHLEVLKNIGMTSMDPINIEGNAIVPLEFLKVLLPDPATLGERYQGKTYIGCFIKGIKDNEPKQIFIYTICDHEQAYREVKSQAVAYTTGVPAMIAAKLIVEGPWRHPGVFHVEQLDPIPFMNDLNEYGLPWKIKQEQHQA
ncbi:MAG: saccharopine dehydrogenase family protein [Kiritimatiellae bacterium]|nr:saccharopine dehydrogenase family protein [Kiritimatiellia bacterium]